MSATLLVLTKSPVAGRVKTRLCPPYSAAQAAALAEAALADTLSAVAEAPARRRVLVLDGEPGPWLEPGFDIVAQGEGGLAERLAAAFAPVEGPALLVGMDTPQLRPALLAHAIRSLSDPANDAVLGATPDGGYWTIGLRRPDPAVFAGVPMSCTTTAATQRERLHALGLHCQELPVLRDVDTATDAQVVAAETPGSRFAEAVADADGDLTLELACQAQ